MKKLNKILIEKMESLRDEINDLKQDLENEIDEYNNQVENLKSNIEEAKTKLEDKLQEAEDFREQVWSEMNSYFYERSDKWMESDAGQSYESWMREWENPIVTGVDVVFPDELQYPDVENQLEDLSQEP